jgi:hypothetical protein
MTTPEPDATLAAIWRSLVEATTRRTAWTLGALATVDGTGAPSVRSIILRDCDPGAGTVAFATDARSAKVAQIAVEPRVAMTFWDDGTGVQLRLVGHATLADAVERRVRWAALGAHTRRGYGSPSVPGTPLAPEDEPARPDDEELWFDRFAWIEVRVDRIDRLDISTDPHERTVLTRTDRGWSGGRVAP